MAGRALVSFKQEVTTTAVHVTANVHVYTPDDVTALPTIGRECGSVTMRFGDYAAAVFFDGLDTVEAAIARLTEAAQELRTNQAVQLASLESILSGAA